MTLQPTTRRLLTEAAAGTAVATAGTPLQTALDTRYPLKTTVGAASGIATLGSDGKVPTAQLPSTAAPLLGAYKATTTSRVSTATLATDPDLTVTVATGTYWIELESFIVVGAGGLTWTFAGTATYTVPSNSGQWAYSGSTTPPGVLALTPGVAAAALPVSTGAVALRLSLPVVVTVAGTVAFMWAQNASNAAVSSVNAGARLRAQKLT